jgi:flavin reductase (DIM6/NTAB) family NADH-FMN oxidoreductase RutF
MATTKINYTAHYDLVMKALTSRGLLLGAYDANGKANLMAIGWGALGNIWGMPIWTVLVRPSRYTYQCIEHGQGFTVCVPTEAMGMACAVCGSKSGRDIDKVKECGLTARRAEHVMAPDIAECPIVYQCHVVHSNDVVPARLADEILDGAYMNADYHRIYFGKILAVRCDPDAAEKLR